MTKRPTILQSLIPILTLIVLISLNVILLGDDTLSGANQLSLLCASAVAIGIAVYNRVPWEHILQGILHTLNTSMSALLILLMIGVLAGTWMLSGIIPGMIYYGLYILKPDYFLPAAAIISAIISGAYFGDKVSPLSDTTNLAAAIAQTNLFTHIRYMMYTTVPTMLITLAIFTLISLFGSSNAPAPDSVREVQQAIGSFYRINLFLFIVPVIVVVMIVKKMPAVPALFIGGLLGGVMALIFQPDVIASLSGEEHLSAGGAYRVVTQAMYGTTTLHTGNETLDSLFTSHGMAGMLNTIWLIITAMIFGGVLEAGRFLERITGALMGRVRSDGGLVTTTAATCILFNATASDQYISIVVPGKMFAGAYRRGGLAPEVLSRTLEDSGTATSVLIPWNTCGATQAGVLGVATFAYLPYAFFCYLSPLMSVAFAWLNIKIRRIGPEQTSGADENPNN